ncbi:MAG: cytochrome c biogenesis protein CcdA [Clostridia bacterium]|nr:cytochrome c biogenesis protein CcdA [Clostridia bacterium]
MNYALCFLEGILTFISPCLLPMLPVYLAYFAAVPAEGKAYASQKRTIINALGFVLGFSVVFTAMGAFAGTVGRFLILYQTPVNIVCGAAVIIMGLNYTGLIKISFLNKTVRGEAQVRDLRFFSALVFGMVFSIGWTPCVGAFLGTALGLAAQTGSLVRGVIMLLVYSLGLALPFVICAWLMDNLKSAFAFIKRNYRIINIVSGGLLIIVGILMIFGIFGRLQSVFTS